MRKLLSALALAALLAGCAGHPFFPDRVQPGTSREAVLARLGPPTRVVALPPGQRLQYSGQPFGQYAWMVDLDAAGKVTQVRQTLNAVDFGRIAVGQWTRDDVEREFGPPALVDGVASWPGPVLTYRWLDRDRSDMFYFIYLDGRGVVQRAHPAMEYVRTPADRD